MKQRIGVGVCLLLSLGITIIFLGYTNSPLASQNQQEPIGTLAATNQEVPEQVFYEQLFSLLVALNNSTDYQKQAALTDDQRSSLERTARECQREIAKQDSKAQITIRALREKRANQEPGAPLPPPPPEIAELQQERDAIVLRHRDRLREALGENAFRRITEAAKRLVHITVE